MAAQTVRRLPQLWCHRYVNIHVDKSGVEMVHPPRPYSTYAMKHSGAHPPTLQRARRSQPVATPG
eukprot:3277753-Pyramimonas_sp.AAC.1